jgi:hypothetical protein
LRDRLEDHAANAIVSSCVNASSPDKSAIPDRRLQYPVQHDAAQVEAVTRDHTRLRRGRDVANADTPHIPGCSGNISRPIPAV